MRFLSAEGAKLLIEAQGVSSATPWVNRPHAVRAEGACRERSLNAFYQKTEARRQKLGHEPVYRERSDPG
jgi:hypothetical protein